MIILRRILLVVLAVAIAYPLFLAFRIWQQSRIDEVRRADAIVVLGAAQWDGQPSPDLRARLDHAADLYNQHYASLIVLTGGSQPGDRYTEADAGQMYLHSRGIPTDAMVKVGGNTTIESLREVSQVLHSKQKTRALMVSDPFHMFRVMHMSNDLGLQPLSSPTRTSPIVPGSNEEKRFVVRESFAYLAYLFIRR